VPATEPTATIGDVTLNENLGSSSFYLWRRTSETFKKPQVRQSETQKQGEHGTEDGISRYGPRVMPFEGEIHAASQSARVTMEQALEVELLLSADQSFDDDDGYRIILFTTEDGIDKQIYAKCIFGPDFTLLDEAMPEVRGYEFTLYAKDPVIYAQELTEETGPESFASTTLTFQDGALPALQDGDLPIIQDETGAEMTVTNAGNYGAPPVFTITGPTTNPVITNTTTGKSMDFSKGAGLMLNEDETLTVNVLAKTIVKTSVGVDSDASGTMTDASKWIYIRRGANVLTLFDDTAGDLSSQLEISFRSAWM